MNPSAWLYPTERGLYCEPGDFYVDPARQVPRAVITHGHSDHARPGHAAVLATPETLAIMHERLGDGAGGRLEALPIGERRDIRGVGLRLAPAGHILGSAQVVLEWKGCTAVVSGDYKREADPTAQGFEPVRCHLFITEATFGLPVFRHEAAAKEAMRLLASIAANPERCHLLGAYALGKCQRMIALLRQAGYRETIYLHGALISLCRLYENLGHPLGPLEPFAGQPAAAMRGKLVLCPPGELAGRWQRRLGDTLTCFASGWMRVRGRARQRGVELPLVVSDHADWPALIRTIEDTGADEVWVTHGREDALTHQIGLMGKRGRALALVGFEDEGD